MGSCAGKFYAFDISTGKIAWFFDVSIDSAYQFHGNPIIIDSLILVGTDEGRYERGALYALNRRDGSLRWKSTGHKSIASDPSFDGDTLVYVVSLNDSLLAFSLSDGAVIWRFFTGWQRPKNKKYASYIERPRAVSSPLVIDDRVYIIGRDSTLYCVNASNGQVVWKHQLKAIATSHLTKADNNLVFGLNDFTLISFDLRTGYKVHVDSIPFMALGGMAYTDSAIVYLGSAEDGKCREVVAFDLRSRTLRWSSGVAEFEPNGRWFVPRIHIWNGNIIVGTSKGMVVAYSTEHGSVVWSHKLEAPIRGIGHSELFLFIGTYDGWLHALQKIE